MNIQYCHVCISCRNVEVISKFYQEVFDCKPLDPKRNMSGTWAGQLIGCGKDRWEEASVIGEHLMVPGYNDDVRLTLELLEYRPKGKDIQRDIFDIGFSHICFQVPTEADVAPLVEKLLAHGGSIASEFDYRNERVAYCRDPEGNLVEIRRPNDVPDTIREM